MGRKAKQRDPWEQRFADLRGFRRRFGHCRVPVDWPENRPLAKWAILQRSRWGHLHTEHLRRLYDLGFRFGRYDRAWLVMFFELVAFQSRHGHCLVPRGRRENPALANWVQTQRNGRDRFSPDRRRRLDAIGFDWNPIHTAWEKRFAELEQFKHRYGHSRVSQLWRENRILGKWVAKQRTRRRLGQISAEERNKLDRLGFVWHPLDSAWEKQFANLQRFQRRHGHCRVPPAHQGNWTLTMWVRIQRRHLRRGLLQPAQEARLDGLGFDWDPKSSDWTRRFEELQRFRARYGHCRVPLRWKATPALGRWVHYMRERAKQHQLSPERKRQLDALGFDWNRRHPTWEEMFAELRRFHACYGHCRVSNNRVENRRLARWVQKQRARRRKQTLLPERRAKLDSVGFTWQERPARSGTAPA
ncbi:MAG: helicase associated domain-containing protein [Verrucomicrobiia bacterium]